MVWITFLRCFAFVPFTAFLASAHQRTPNLNEDGNMRIDVFPDQQNPGYATFVFRMKPNGGQ